VGFDCNSNLTLYQGGLLDVSEFHILAYKMLKPESLIIYFLLSKSLVMTTSMLEKSKKIQSFQVFCEVKKGTISELW